jgi:hypothetical protein
VFDEIAGLPLHPLTVHAAVVFVPLLALVSAGYALVPKLRRHLVWAAVALSIIAPIAAVVAVLSGDAFQQRRGLPLEGALADHRSLGITAMVATLVLAAATLVLVWLRRRGVGSAPATWSARIVTVVLVVAAVVALFYIVRAGDTGSRMVWEQIWQFVQ